MKQIHDFLKSYNLKPTRYKKNGQVYFVESDGKTYAIKKKNKYKDEIYKYLDSRHFNYYPDVLNDDEEYEVTSYIEDIDYPKEQKIMDLIDLVALLHSKTTFYKEIEKDYFKKTYEDIEGNIEYLEEYYNDLIEVIEKEVYTSPSSYLLARNINLIFSSLYYAKEEIEKWYDMVQSKNRARFVVLHNNLKLEHFLKNQNSYLTSWDQSRIDIPIFDLYKLYKNHADNFDFELLLKEYEKKYPLLEEERTLLFILISIPPKLEFNDSMFDTCKIFTKEIDLLYKTRLLITSYNK
jgi:hypothetical protein